MQLIDTSKKRVDESLEQAFKDMRALMDKAQEMVVLAERLRRSVMNDTTASEQNVNSAQWMHVMEDLTRLGIGSPVSRELSENENSYYVELARQVYDFAIKHIAKNNTTLLPITLIDLYCLYNRARGTHLISPDDLLRACQLFASLGLNDLKLEKFPSGVLALIPQHPDQATDIVRTLVSHITQHGPATALQLANALHLSLPLTTHYLLVRLLSLSSPLLSSHKFLREEYDLIIIPVYMYMYTWIHNYVSSLLIGWLASGSS
jgi:ESCRT-II complex subunit VPS36